MSDLHLEFEPQPTNGARRGRPFEPLGIMSASEKTLAVDADFVLLPGDIHTKDRAPEWAAKTFKHIPVILLGGNHEPYSDSLYANVARNRKATAACGPLPDGTPHVSFLERETWTWASPRGERIRVIGTTFWTDFGNGDIHVFQLHCIMKI